MSQTSENNQFHLPTIVIKPLPLPNATTTSPCLTLVNWPYRISSKTCVNHSTISILHSKYFHTNNPGGYLPKLSAADIHHTAVNQLLKAVNAAQITKALVYTKNKPLI